MHQYLQVSAGICSAETYAASGTFSAESSFSGCCSFLSLEPLLPCLTQLQITKASCKFSGLIRSRVSSGHHLSTYSRSSLSQVILAVSAPSLKEYKPRLEADCQLEAGSRSSWGFPQPLAKGKINSTSRKAWTLRLSQVFLSFHRGRKEAEGLSRKHNTLSHRIPDGACPVSSGLGRHTERCQAQLDSSGHTLQLTTF